MRLTHRHEVCYERQLFKIFFLSFEQQTAYGSTKGDETPNVSASVTALSSFFLNFHIFLSHFLRWTFRLR